MNPKLFNIVQKGVSEAHHLVKINTIPVKLHIAQVINSRLKLIYRQKCQCHSGSYKTTKSFIRHVGNHTSSILNLSPTSLAVKSRN